MRTRRVTTRRLQVPERARSATTRSAQRYLYAGSLVTNMRYGENPHQEQRFTSTSRRRKARWRPQRSCKARNSLTTTSRTATRRLECVKQFEAPACVIVKHANPCGVAVADSHPGRLRQSFKTDPTSAFGGIIAFNRPLDAKTPHSEIIDKQFVEVIVAPSIDGRCRRCDSRPRKMCACWKLASLGRAARWRL